MKLIWLNLRLAFNWNDFIAPLGFHWLLTPIQGRARSRMPKVGIGSAQKECQNISKLNSFALCFRSSSAAYLQLLLLPAFVSLFVLTPLIRWHDKIHAINFGCVVRASTSEETKRLSNVIESIHSRKLWISVTAVRKRGGLPCWFIKLCILWNFHFPTWSSSRSKIVQHAGGYCRIAVALWVWCWGRRKATGLATGRMCKYT